MEAALLMRIPIRSFSALSNGFVLFLAASMLLFDRMYDHFSMQVVQGILEGLKMITVINV